MVRSNRGAISLGSIRASRGAPTLAKSLTVGALLGARLWFAAIEVLFLLVPFAPQEALQH